MSRFLTLTLAVTLVSAIMFGCSTDTTTTSEPNDNTTSNVDHADHDHDAITMNTSANVLCGHCGDAKDTAACCAADAEKCADCDLNKGSKLCCVTLEASATGKDLCLTCGHVASGDQCCAEGADSCNGCGLNAGSPLCCKLEDAE